LFACCCPRAKDLAQIDTERAFPLDYVLIELRNRATDVVLRQYAERSALLELLHQVDDIEAVLSKRDQTYRPAATGHIGDRGDHHVARTDTQPMGVVLQLFHHDHDIARTVRIKRLVHALQRSREVGDVALRRVAWTATQLLNLRIGLRAHTRTRRNKGPEKAGADESGCDWTKIHNCSRWCLHRPVIVGQRSDAWKGLTGPVLLPVRSSPKSDGTTSRG
jgi:hypothetical protein